MRRAVLPVLILASLALSAGAASAAPLYAFDVTYVTPVLHVGDETIRLEAATVPVPTAIGNTPRAFMEDADANGVPVAGEAAPLLPGGDHLVDARTSWNAAIAIVDELVDLLPDGAIRVAGYETSTGTATGSIQFYAAPLAEQGYYKTKLFAHAPTTPPDLVAPASGATATPDHGRFTLPPAAPVPHDALPRNAAPGGDVDAVEPVTGTNGDTDAATATAATAPAPGMSASVRTATAAAAAIALPALIGWALYHRIRGSTHLNQGTRKAIYDAVCGKPGAGVSDVANATGVSYSTAAYHLDRLTRAQLLVVTGSGPRLRYYKNGGDLNERERAVHEIFESEGAVRVLAAIRAKPGTYRAALADALGVTPTTVNWHLKRLRDAGLVREQRLGRSAALYVDEDAARTLVPRVLEKVTPTPETERARSLLLDRANAPTAYA